MKEDVKMGKNKEKIVRILIYFVIELLFMGIMCLYLWDMKNAYSVNVFYDNELFKVIIIGMIFLVIFIGPMLNRYICFLYAAIYSIYLIAQKVYFKAFGQYFRLTYALSIKDEWTAMKTSVDEFVTVGDFKQVIIMGIICLVFVILYFLLQRRVFKLRYRLIYKAASLLLFIPITSTIKNYNESLLAEEGINDGFQFYHTDYYVYLTVPNTNQFVEKFGVLSLAMRDISTSYETNQIYDEQKGQVDELLNNRLEHESNEMTGIFEGKNVLFVMAESLITEAIDEQLTPTLYKMMTEGINIVGYGNSLLPCSTSDSEFMANTSLIPNSNEFGSCYKYEENAFPTTLATIFANKGYRVDAYHNNYSEYYNRKNLFADFGYEKFWDCTEMGMDDVPADTAYMDVFAWIYPWSESKWMAYWITYSGHQPYDYSSVAVKQEYVDQILSVYPYLTEDYVSYLAKIMDLDKSLEMFMNTLSYENRLDDCVIVLFGDHMVKGLSFEEDSPYYELTGKEYSDEDLKTGLFIYNTQVTPLRYEKISTNLDLLPTIANMFNLDYDNKTILGRDIFDSNYDGFYFTDYNFYRTDDFSFNDNGELFDPKGNDFNESLYPRQKAQELAEYYLNMREMSKVILETDYFKTEE